MYIARQLQGSGYAKQNSSLLTSSDYNDPNVSNGTTYYYVVTAVMPAERIRLFRRSFSHAQYSCSPEPEQYSANGGQALPGTAVSDLTSDVNYPDNSTGRELLTKLGRADKLGGQLRHAHSRYVIPPADGNYTFWIASDADSELWLSTDDNPANASADCVCAGQLRSHRRFRLSARPEVLYRGAA